MKYSTKEFADYDIYEIAEKYIEGEPEISKEAVHRDEVSETEKDSINRDKATGFITGLSTEDVSIKEGIVKYDINLTFKKHKFK